MQEQSHVQEIPHCIRDDVSFEILVILNAVKDLQMQAQHHVQEIPHCIRDDVSFGIFDILNLVKDLQMQASATFGRSLIAFGMTYPLGFSSS
ncbi:hypothetical protein [Legionella quateirensis]|uniref:hypothetical protein n=1 Tax=Legionella quateirensis TaxID=45072 RepID=UPI000730223A|nr:hypothetical protein [Legionella quateirensis]